MSLLCTIHVLLPASGESGRAIAHEGADGVDAHSVVGAQIVGHLALILVNLAGLAGKAARTEGAGEAAVDGIGVAP